MKTRKFIPLFIIALLFLVLAVVPAIVVASGNEQLYAVSNDGSTGNIQEIDTLSNTVISSIASVTNPSFITGNPSGTELYVSDFSGERVQIIQPITNNVIANINLGDNPVGVAINSKGTLLYVALNETHAIAVIDLTTRSVTSTITIPGGSTLWAVDITPDDSKVYVTDITTNNVYVISTQTNSLTATIGVVDNPWAISVSPSNDKVFVISNLDNYSLNGTMAVISVSGNNILSNVTVIKGSYGVSVDKAGSYVYLSGGIDKILNKYSTIDYSKQATIAITCGADPYDYPVVVGAGANSNIYVSHGQNITVVNPSSNSVIATIYTIGGFNIQGMTFITPSGIIPAQPEPVYIYVHSYHVLKWQGVNISVYNSAGQLLESQVSDNNGGATFTLTPGTLYTINVNSGSLGINSTVSYTPPNNYGGTERVGIQVIPFLSWVSGGRSGGITVVANQSSQPVNYSSGYADRDILFSTITSRSGTTGYINCSFEDKSCLSDMVSFKLSKRTAGTGNYSVVQSAMVYFQTGSGELLVNGDCEAGEPTLHGTGNDVQLTSALSSTYKHAGSYSLNLTTGAGGTANRWYELGDEVGGDLNGLAAGKENVYDAWVYVPSSSGIVLSSVHIALYDASAGWEESRSSTPGAYDAWQKLSVNRTIRASANMAISRVVVAQDIAGKSIYVDDLSLKGNKTWYNFTVTGVNANNRDFYVTAETHNTLYGNVTRTRPAIIPWQSLLPGIPEVWHFYLAIIIIIGIFAASVVWMNGIISLCGAGAAYVFYSIGWLDTVQGAGLGVTAAVIAAILYYYSRRETGGGLE